MLCIEDCPRGLKEYSNHPAGSNYSDCIAVHAEMMALREAGYLEDKDGFVGWTMVVTCQPCKDCRTVLNAAGIYVVYGEDLT